MADEQVLQHEQENDSSIKCLLMCCTVTSLCDANLCVAINTSTHGINIHDLSTWYIADLCHTPQRCAARLCIQALFHATK